MKTPRVLVVESQQNKLIWPKGMFSNCHIKDIVINPYFKVLFEIFSVFTVPGENPDRGYWIISKAENKGWFLVCRYVNFFFRVHATLSHLVCHAVQKDTKSQFSLRDCPSPHLHYWGCCVYGLVYSLAKSPLLQFSFPHHSHNKDERKLRRISSAIRKNSIKYAPSWPIFLYSMIKIDSMHTDHVK